MQSGHRDKALELGEVCRLFQAAGGSRGLLVRSDSVGLDRLAKTNDAPRAGAATGVDTCSGVDGGPSLRFATWVALAPTRTSVAKSAGLLSGIVTPRELAASARSGLHARPPSPQTVKRRTNDVKSAHQNDWGRKRTAGPTRSATGLSIGARGHQFPNFNQPRDCMPSVHRQKIQDRAPDCHSMQCHTCAFIRIG